MRRITAARVTTQTHARLRNLSAASDRTHVSIVTAALRWSAVQTVTSPGWSLPPVEQLRADASLSLPDEMRALAQILGRLARPTPQSLGAAAGSAVEAYFAAHTDKYLLTVHGHVQPHPVFLPHDLLAVTA